MGGKRMAKRSSLGSLMRSRLSDITNTHSQPKPVSRDEKPQQNSPSEDYINQLIQENMSLLKLTEERDKIIELSGTELQNLRSCLQKLQLQNWNLAQTNNQLLAELYLGRDKVNLFGTCLFRGGVVFAVWLPGVKSIRDKVKALRHELVCKDALLKAKNLEKKGKVGINCRNTITHGEQATEGCMSKANDEYKRRTPNRRRNARSQSIGPSTTTRRGGDKEKVERKRSCLRLQSGSVKSPEAKELIEIDDLDFIPTYLLETPLVSSLAMEETCMSEKRSSMGRPIHLQTAVDKVQSYKEVPVNINMLRTE